MNPLSLYIHVPFCLSKCAYCDFASYPGREGDWARYFEALWGEIGGWKSALRGYEAATVFVGGGTPPRALPLAIAAVISQQRRLRDREEGGGGSEWSGRWVEVESRNRGGAEGAVWCSSCKQKSTPRRRGPLVHGCTPCATHLASRVR